MPIDKFILSEFLEGYNPSLDKTRLFLDIIYNWEKDSIKINSNIKEEKIPDVILNYLRAQIGRGEDKSKAIERDVYHIKIELYLEKDLFRIHSDVGNKGLRDGILLHVLDKKYNKHLKR